MCDVMYVYVCCDFVIFHLKIVSYVFILLVSTAVQRVWSGVFHTYAYKQKRTYTTTFQRRTSNSPKRRKKQTNQREKEKERKREEVSVCEWKAANV